MFFLLYNFGKTEIVTSFRRNRFSFQFSAEFYTSLYLAKKLCLVHLK